MSKHPKVLLALVSALAASACAIDDVGDAVTDTRTGAGDQVQRASVEQEFAEVARNCQLPTATLARVRGSYRLGLPAEIYAERDRPPAAGRVSCILHWAGERGLALTVEAKR